MQTSKYHVGDIVQPYQCDGPYCIAKVRFDDIGNPIYTAIAEGQPYLLLRDTEIVRLINTATPDFVCEPHDNTGDITPDEANGAGWPGDGSGTDDLADYNANEADDYRNEGEE